MQNHPRVWPFLSRSNALPPDDTASAGLARSVPNHPRETRQGTGQPVPTFSPCPFCHGTRVAAHKPDTGLFWAVYCENAACGATGPLAVTEAEAIRGWNRRPWPGFAERLAELARSGPEQAAEDFRQRLRAAADDVLHEPYVPQPGVDVLDYVQARLRERLDREFRDFLDKIRPPEDAPNPAPTEPFGEIWPAPKCGPAPSKTEDSE